MHFTAIFDIAREYCAIKSAMMIAIDLCAISIANRLRSMFVLIITQINSTKITPKPFVQFMIRRFSILNFIRRL